MIFGLASRDLLSWIVAAFFLVGAVGNGFASRPVKADYARWGYPRGFHRVTGVLELAVAVLLTLSSTRLWGVGLGAAVMLAAIATLLQHKEYRHALIPTTTLIVLILLGVWSL